MHVCTTEKGGTIIRTAELDSLREVMDRYLLIRPFSFSVLFDERFAGSITCLLLRIDESAMKVDQRYFLFRQETISYGIQREI